MIIAESVMIKVQTSEYKSPQVSLVIPVYNAENYLVRSIDSALAQSFPDLEIIVIDDGSTDHTPEMIDWYAEKNPNVVAVHQENSGAATARNVGIGYAQGKYIGFLDSDDMLRPDMITKLYSSIKANNCDIAITSAYWIDDSGHKAVIQYSMKEDIDITVDEFFNRYYGNGGYGVVIWNKLYRANLVKSHLFPVIPVEDEAWTPYILSYAEKICYLDCLAYEYDRRCNNTLSEKISRRSKEEFFIARRNAIMFYLENCNIQRKGILKELAKRQLSALGRAYAYDGYEKLRKQIDENF